MFFKGGSIPSAWNDDTNYAEVETTCQRYLGWLNAVKLKGKHKSMLIITVRRLVDSNVNGVSTCKVQRENKIGKAKNTN